MLYDITVKWMQCTIGLLHIFYQNGKVAITPMSRSRNRYFLLGQPNILQKISVTGTRHGSYGYFPVWVKIMEQANCTRHPICSDVIHHEQDIRDI